MFYLLAEEATIREATVQERCLLGLPTPQEIQQPIVCHQNLLFICTNSNSAMRKSLKALTSCRPS